MSRIREEFEAELENARNQAKICADENAKSKKNRSDLLLELNDAEAAQQRAEQDIEKLRTTLRFERNLHRQEMKEMCRKSQINSQRHQIQISEKYKAQLNDSLNYLRGQLEDQIRSHHLHFNDQMNSFHASQVNSDVSGAGARAITDAHGQHMTTSAKIADLNSKLSICQSMISLLEKQDKYWQKVLDGDAKQIDGLRRTIKDLCKKYKTLLDDKVKIQHELDAYNNLLKSEECRLNVSDLCGEMATRIVPKTIVSAPATNSDPVNVCNDNFVYEIDIDISKMTQ